MSTHALWHPFADMGAVPGNELVIDRGEGAYLWDEQGRRYLDASSGLWYSQVGHGREEIVDAIDRQLRELDAYPTFGLLANRPALEVADRLAALSPLADTRVILTLGGGDGIDTAAKLARLYWAVRGQPERRHLIRRSYAYHGTHGFGTSLAGMEPLRNNMGPLDSAVSEVAYDDPASLERELERVGPDQVAAFFCEPLIGAGGVRPCPEGYMEAVGDVCRRHGVLLVIDSVIGAFGRLGTWLGFERWPIEPDLVVLAKGLTSGYLPLGAVLVRDRVAEPFFAAPGGPMFRHGATYAGHPTCCAAALANLDILEREGLIPRGAELEVPLTEALAPLTAHPAVGEIRSGLGFAAAVELAVDLRQRLPGAVGAFDAAVREAGVLTRVQTTGVAIGPPLIVEQEHIDEIVGALRTGLDAVAQL